MRWQRYHYAVEMTDEPCYTFGSSDNTRKYFHEYLLESEYRPSSKHGLICSHDGKTCSSAVLGASGGQTAVHSLSCVVLEDRCLVAVGDRVAALALPDLTLLWAMKADDATCFGLYLTGDQRHVVVHGELEISKITADGHKLWSFSGRDIFTGEFALNQGIVLVTDFNGDKYVIDVMQGTGSIVA